MCCMTLSVKRIPKYDRHHGHRLALARKKIENFRSIVSVTFEVAEHTLVNGHFG